MSDIATDVFLEQMWEKHREEYLRWCDSFNWQGNGADFWLYLEEHDLIPGDIYEAD